MSVSVSSEAPSEFSFEEDELPLAEEVDVREFRETEEGKKLTSWLLSKYSSAKSARESEERQWKKNLAMYNGKHYLQVIKQGQFAGQLMERPKDPNKDRRTINRIESLCRTEISRLVSQKPSASVLPSSSDDEDMFAAMAGEQIWESHQTRRHLQAVVTDAAFWLTITGNGFIKTYWDESAEDVDADVMGDVVYENVSPFNFLVPDLRETDLEKQAYVINYYTKSIEWLQMFYPDELEGVDLNPKVNAANEILEDTYLNLSGADKSAPDSVIVYEFWVKPGACKFLPTGGRIVLADDVMVAYTPQLPYKHKQYPFAHAGHILTGKFYRRSVLNSVNELQEEYNSARSQVSDIRKKMGKPQILAQKGSISAARWSNETGLVIEVKPGFQFPQPMPMASLPPYFMEEQQAILTDIEDISGQHQVSKGNVPPGVTAATAISYLQEKDDSYMVSTSQSFEAMCEKIAKQTLVLVVQFWDIPRLVKVGGSDSQFDTLTLAGSDIATGTDIRIEGGSSLPTSKAARQAFIMDLMTQQIVTPEQGLDILEIGGAQKLMDSLKSDQRQAQRENVRMKSLDDQTLAQYAQDWQQRSEMMDPSTLDKSTQQPLEMPPAVPVNSWDNHDIHIETHNKYRRSQAFDYLSDAVKVQFESHVEMHKTMKRQEALEEMMQMLPTDGSVPGVSGLMDQGGQPEAEVSDGSGSGVPTENLDPSMQEGDVPIG